MLRVLGRVMKKEFIQTFRDKRMLMVILVVPLIQTVLFGFAINLDLTAQPTVVVDLDRTQQSRNISRLIVENDGFNVTHYADTQDEAENDILLGKAALAFLIPRGFEKDLAAGGAEIQIVMDGSDSNTALRAGQQISQILNHNATERIRIMARERIQAAGRSADTLLPRVEIQSRAWFNPRMRSAVFFVPAVLGMVLIVITMLLTSMGLTREKEIGTLEQIMVTPLRPWQLIVGKTLPFAIIGLVDVLLIVMMAAVVFDIPIMGPIWGLIGVSALFLTATLGLGLFISTVSATQQQAMMNAFFVILPAVMLSGFVYPIENMPEWVQWLTMLNPLRYYMTLVRGIMVKGATPWELWETCLHLAALGLIVITAASLRFKKRLG